MNDDRSEATRPRSLDSSLTPRNIQSLNDGDLQTAMRYDEFLLELGVLLRLPPRKPNAASLSRDPSSTRRTRLALPVLALAILGVFVVNIWRPREVVRVPIPLIGTWETDDPRYIRRSFSVSASHLLLVTERSIGPMIHPIRDARALGQRGDTTEFLIAYKSEDGDSELRLRHIGGDNATIILKNPGDVRWRRARESEAASALTAEKTPPA